MTPTYDEHAHTHDNTYDIYLPTVYTPSHNSQQKSCIACPTGQYQPGTGVCSPNPNAIFTILNFICISWLRHMMPGVHTHASQSAETRMWIVPNRQLPRYSSGLFAPFQCICYIPMYLWYSNSKITKAFARLSQMQYWDTWFYVINILTRKSTHTHDNTYDIYLPAVYTHSHNLPQKACKGCPPGYYNTLTLVIIPCPEICLPCRAHALPQFAASRL